MRSAIETALGKLEGVEVIVFEPTAKYQNVAKRKGVEKLTPARALIAEIIRRYWVLGIECTLVETQKLAWCLGRTIRRLRLPDPLKLRFQADRYGPYAHQLTKLLEALDGSYLHCEKRLTDASAFDTIWFDETRRETIDAYFRTAEARDYLPALDATDTLIDGFQSPLGMEVLATVDWLIEHAQAEPTITGMRHALEKWPAGPDAAQRKQRLFTDRLIALALERLRTVAVA